MTMESVRRVALVATTRTGSTWLGALLDSHPEIRFRGEIFNLEHATAAAVLDPEAYLDEALSAAGPHRLVGFKLLYHQARLDYLNGFLLEMDEGRPSRVDWRTLFPARPVTEVQAPALARPWARIRDDGTRIIHLRRRNLLRRYVSHEILMAASRARWKAAPETRHARVRLAPDRVVESFAQATAAADEVDRFFSRSAVLAVFYEELAAAPAAEWARILDFLGVRRAPLGAAARERRAPSLREKIENYDRVERSLAGTPWEAFLAEP
jgi:LPS sulfotransferase NodH